MGILITNLLIGLGFTGSILYLIIGAIVNAFYKKKHGKKKDRKIGIIIAVVIMVVCYFAYGAQNAMLASMPKY